MQRLRLWWLRRRWRRLERRLERRHARARQRAARSRWRIAALLDPRVYLVAVIVTASLALLVSVLADGVIALRQPFAAQGAETGCRVSRVVDGDTVTFFCPGHGFQRTRLVGFDAPELTSPACPSEFAAALRAQWTLRRLLLQADEMRVWFRGEDRYGRRLAVVSLDGIDLARLMIDAGVARRYSGGMRRGWCG